MKMLAFVFILFSTSSFCQDYLLLKDGSTLVCDRFKFLQSKGIVKITLLNGQKKEISLTEVDGLIYGKKKAVEYWRPYTTDLNDFNLLEKIEDGKVKLYQLVTSGNPGPYGPGVSQVSTFLEKDNSYQSISFGFLDNKKKNLDVLRLFITDNPRILERINKEDFKLTSNSLREIIQLYNIDYFDANEKSLMNINGKKQVNVSFYLKNKSDIEKYILYSDQKFNINPFANILLPLSEYSKICPTIDGVTHCVIFKPVPNVQNVLEIKVIDNFVKLIPTDMVWLQKKISN